LIEVEGLTKRFGAQLAISDISFRAETGEILGFLGPNGAGKTTTMRILTCYLPPTSGGARVAGYDILEDSREVRRRIGYLPENVPLYPDLSVRAYLDFVGKLKGMPKSTRATHTGQVMAECGIHDVRERTIGKLSKGYRQRVGLAQALLNDPEVLILDEPTIGLDPQQIIEIRKLIRNLAGKRTIILSTHILPEVSVLCQRVLIVNKGKLISADTPENLKSGLRRSLMIDVVVRGDRDSVARHIGALRDVRSVKWVESFADDSHSLRIESNDNIDIREQVSHTVVEGGFGLLSLNTTDLSLEDIFVQLVTKEENE
jgi:ABC-2 type transport system ATP-binding protein